MRLARGKALLGDASVDGDQSDSRVALGSRPTRGGMTLRSTRKGGCAGVQPKSPSTRPTSRNACHADRTDIPWVHLPRPRLLSTMSISMPMTLRTHEVHCTCCARCPFSFPPILVLLLQLQLQRRLVLLLRPVLPRLRRLPLLLLLPVLLLLDHEYYHYSHYATTHYAYYCDYG